MFFVCFSFDGFVFFIRTNEFEHCIWILCSVERWTVKVTVCVSHWVLLVSVSWKQKFFRNSHFDIAEWCIVRYHCSKEITISTHQSSAQTHVCHYLLPKICKLFTNKQLVNTLWNSKCNSILVNKYLLLFEHVTHTNINLNKLQ